MADVSVDSSDEVNKASTPTWVVVQPLGRSPMPVFLGLGLPVPKSEERVPVFAAHDTSYWMALWLAHLGHRFCLELCSSPLLFSFENFYWFTWETERERQIWTENSHPLLYSLKAPTTPRITDWVKFESQKPNPGSPFGRQGSNHHAHIVAYPGLHEVEVGIRSGIVDIKRAS